jgi:hypothetical protein
VIVILLILLLMPLLAVLGMIMLGSGMMAQISGGMMGGSVMALCAIWVILVAAALVFLIVLLVRRNNRNLQPGEYAFASSALTIYFWTRPPGWNRLWNTREPESALLTFARLEHAGESGTFCPARCAPPRLYLHKRSVDASN